MPNPSSAAMAVTGLPSLLPVAVLIVSAAAAAFLFVARSSAKRRRRRSPPGPDGWPVLGNLPQLGAKPHQKLHELSKEYGPIMGLKFGAADVVVASSAAVAEQFLRVHDANFSNRPPNSGAEFVAYNYQDLVFAPYGPRWRALRKICALNLFSTKALDELRHVREGEVARMVAALAGGGAGEVNLGLTVNACATNALARATVGRRVFEEGGATEFKEMVVELMRLAGEPNVGDFVPWLKLLDPQGLVAKMKRLHTRFDELFDGFIAGKRNTAIKRAAAGGEDLLGMLLRVQAERKGSQQAETEELQLNDTDIKALLLNLFTAGTDTTASTVEWAMAELVRHPEILRQAQSELDAVVGRDRLVSEHDLPNLPLMQAIIKETFRTHPSTPLSLPRLASDDCVVAGYEVPKNANLLVNIWAIARDPAVWADPLEFRPARFLPGGAHEGVDVKGSNFELIPFGAGRRICAGMSLGLRMVQLMTATLVHAFDWVLPEGLSPAKINMEEAFGLTLQRAAPLTVRPLPRLAAAAYAGGAAAH